MTYQFAINWMKVTTWLVILMSIPGFLFHSFDPFYSLEGMILKDVYGNDIPSEQNLTMYRFALSLFALLSIIYGALQLYIIKHLVEKADRKIVKLLFLMIILWVSGCTFLIVKFNTWSYFYSAGGMAVMWLPVLGWMTLHHPRS
ncbi:MAG: hypothetical protein K2X86_01660 [Cytophagaceae bacterium]|nr:hypothetical protein [Cytophagaceae bacterium]